MEKRNYVIDSFIENYNDSDEKRYYDHIKEMAVEKVASGLKEAGCKAIILSRIKEKDSLQRKLYKRNHEKNYQSKNDICQDICDFMGLRILLYYPNEIEIAEKIVENVFDVNRGAIRHPKEDKLKQHEKSNRYKKKFSGYTAVHYHASLRADSLDKPEYQELSKNSCAHIFEIQITSLVLHAWAEVEHDIVYKPDKSRLPFEAHFILDEINGLMQVGEMAFMRLREELLKNINESGNIQDQYELSAYIRDNVPQDVLDNHEIGNMKYLFNLMKYSGVNIKDKVDEMIEDISFGSLYYLAGEFIAYLMAEDGEYYRRLYLSRSNIHNTEVIADYRNLVKRYSELLHLAYKKGRELGKYDQLKVPCNGKGNFVDSLLTELLQEDVTEIMNLRNALYKISDDELWQCEDTIYRKLECVEKYLEKIREL